MAIPSILIDPLRSALQSAGVDARTVRDDGTINPAGFLASAFHTVEFRSSATPTIRVATGEMLNEGGQPDAFTAWLRPTVVLKGKSGDVIIAPVGESKGGSILPGLGVALVLFGAGYALGRLR